MAPRNEASHLKRPRLSPPDAESDTKKPRRSDRLSQRVDSYADDGGPSAAEPKTPQQVPTPMTYLTAEDTGSEHQRSKEPTATPPEGYASQAGPRPVADNDESYGSYSSDTQAFPSQYIDPNVPLSDEVQDEVKEGVWGYLFPLNASYGTRSVVMKRRPAGIEEAQGASSSSSSKKKGSKKKGSSKDDGKNKHATGYLIGRHPECDVVVDDPIVSNRHCLIFAEHRGQSTVAVIEDLSSNGTFVNDAIIGRNKRRELQEMDEIAVLNKAGYVFRYPKSRTTTAFYQQYTLGDRLGKGHFAEVYRCVEKATGKRYAVKVFTKTPGVEDPAKTDGLGQEIAVLMGVNHPNVLCLKDAFNERSAVYLVLELAEQGELFNYIVDHQRMTEAETRKLFKQLFAGIKYLHERNIVHRDIKPENILLVDNNLHAKLADFGLAKIIGEESFTTTLCGTPSYVAPEIIANSRNRKYTKAVDVWSLGVVLYICLCGFPPFSDELNNAEFPSMSAQIRAAQFTYPSPYWDSVGDLALELIDCMLVVDPEKRYTVEECLAHPWMTEAPNVNDSTDGLVGGVAGLQVNRRTGLSRERTLLSALKDVTQAVAVKVGRAAGKPKETRPADNRDPGVFMELGDKGDPSLYTDDGTGYTATDITAHKKGKAGKR